MPHCDNPQRKHEPLTSSHELSQSLSQSLLSSQVLQSSPSPCANSTSKPHPQYGTHFSLFVKVNCHLLNSLLVNCFVRVKLMSDCCMNTGLNELLICGLAAVRSSAKLTRSGTLPVVNASAGLSIFGFRLAAKIAAELTTPFAPKLVPALIVASLSVADNGTVAVTAGVPLTAKPYTCASPLSAQVFASN